MSASLRIEKDSIGEISIDGKAYWGSQTERSRLFFKIGDELMPLDVVRALVLIKREAAYVNGELGCIKPEYAKTIITACDEVLRHNRFLDQFPLRVWQTGSGTQSNMNVNEVISNIANVLLGSAIGQKSPIHPNDHVNFGQSSNDCFPTAMHIAAAIKVNEMLFPALQKLQKSLKAKAESFQDILKVARTHLQDATPMTVGQEFSAFAHQITLGIDRIKRSLDSVYSLAQGGTAVGTGLNTHKDFPGKFAQAVASYTKLPFRTAENKFEALATHDALVELSGALNTLAVSLMKIGNDIRLLGSGPRAGLNELQLPENEPGSSIMPGKVNPTQAEALTMVAAQIMGNHVTVSVAGSQGHLQLNVFKPVIAYNILQSIRLLSDACDSFSEHCVAGIEINHDQLKNNVEHSLMIATALNTVIGYDKAAQVAKKAHREKTSLKEAALSLGFITSEEYDKHVRPESMIEPFTK